LRIAVIHVEKPSDERFAVGLNRHRKHRGFGALPGIESSIEVSIRGQARNAVTRDVTVIVELPANVDFSVRRELNGFDNVVRSGTWSERVVERSIRVQTGDPAL